MDNPLHIDRCVYCGSDDVHTYRAGIFKQGSGNEREDTITEGVMAFYHCCDEHGCGRDFRVIWDISMVTTCELYGEYYEKQHKERIQQLQSMMNKLLGALTGDSPNIGEIKLGEDGITIQSGDAIDIDTDTNVQH